MTSLSHEDPQWYKIPISNLAPPGKYLVHHLQDPRKATAFSYLWSTFCLANWCKFEKKDRCMKGYYTDLAYDRIEGLRKIIDEHQHDDQAPFDTSVSLNLVHWNDENGSHIHHAILAGPLSDEEFLLGHQWYIDIGLGDFIQIYIFGG